MMGPSAEKNLTVRESPESAYRDSPLWTDEYSSLLAILFRSQ